MKRSEINNAIKKSMSSFAKNGWFLPPNPRWDVTDFGLGNFVHCGLVLVNLAEEAEYCEKLMYAQKNQITPSHFHKKKKEDIICRNGTLVIQLWTEDPAKTVTEESLHVKVNGKFQTIASGEKMILQSGERVTIVPGVWHKFYADSDECIIGEVSTANDDLDDNFFSNPKIGRFSELFEDEPALVKLLSEK